eukprot:5796198-Prymnesium_polylepis.2
MCIRDSKDASQHRESKLEQRCGHDLHHQRAVTQQQREQRRDDGRLALAHQHLVADRTTSHCGLHELAHEMDLLAPQHEAGRELEHEQPRVKRRRVRLLWPPHVCALRRKQAGELVRKDARLARPLRARRAAARALDELCVEPTRKRQCTRGVRGSVDHQ